MPHPLVLLVAASPGDAAPLLDRLAALGFRCELVTGPVSLGAGEPAVALLLGGTDVPDLPEGVPVLRVGGSGTGREDEEISADTGDAALAARLRVWARWSSLALTGSERSGGEQPKGPSTLPGHKAFVTRLAEEVMRHERYDAPLGLVLADIEGLREINTRYGHRTGDRVIREVGETLGEAVRATDCVFHYGGDTFAVILTHATAEATRRAVSRLRSVFASRILRGDPEGAAPPPLLKISMSFGHVALPEAGPLGPDELVAAAEKALAAARPGASGTAIPTGQP